MRGANKRGRLTSILDGSGVPEHGEGTSPKGRGRGLGLSRLRSSHPTVDGLRGERARHAGRGGQGLRPRMPGLIFSNCRSNHVQLRPDRVELLPCRGSSRWRRPRVLPRGALGAVETRSPRSRPPMRGHTVPSMGLQGPASVGGTALPGGTAPSGGTAPTMGAAPTVGTTSTAGRAPSAGRAPPTGRTPSAGRAPPGGAAPPRGATPLGPAAVARRMRPARARGLRLGALPTSAPERGIPSPRGRLPIRAHREAPLPRTGWRGRGHGSLGCSRSTEGAEPREGEGAQARKQALCIGKTKFPYQAV